MRSPEGRGRDPERERHRRHPHVPHRGVEADEADTGRKRLDHRPPSGREQSGIRGALTFAVPCAGRLLPQRKSRKLRPKRSRTSNCSLRERRTDARCPPPPDILPFSFDSSVQFADQLRSSTWVSSPVGHRSEFTALTPLPPSPRNIKIIRCLSQIFLEPRILHFSKEIYTQFLACT